MTKIPSLFLLLINMSVPFFPLMTRSPHQRVSLGLVPRPPLRIQAGSLHETRRYSESVPKSSILLLLRLSDRVSFAHAKNLIKPSRWPPIWHLSNNIVYTIHMNKKSIYYFKNTCCQFNQFKNYFKAFYLFFVYDFALLIQYVYWFTKKRKKITS